MEFQRIRVLLDLSELKDRLHKYIWMLVSTSDLKSIADFKDAVIKKLALDRNVKDIKMFINGGLLLEEENILILRENDAVQIQYENVSTTDVQITSFIAVQQSLMSDVGLSSELCNDNQSKAVEKPKKKKLLSEVDVIDAPNSYKEGYSHKRKRKRDVVPNESSEDHVSINLSPEESAMTFCDINEESICNEKKKKQKKSCTASTPKEDLVETEQCNNSKAQEKSPTTIWDINEENIYESKKTNPTEYSCTSMAKHSIQIEEDNDKNVIYAESAFVVSDNKSTAKENKRKSRSNCASSDAFIQKHHYQDDEEISIIPLEISLDDSSQEINKMETNDNDQSNVTVESFVQTNNCKKKKKRKRHRKRKIEHNLVSPFMAENIITLLEPVKDLPTFNSYDNCSGVRKHIMFTSPEPDFKKKETEVVDLENCNLNNISEISLDTSLNKSCISSNTKTISCVNERHENNTTPVANGSSSNMNAAYSKKSFELNSSTVSSSKSNFLHELSLKNPVSKSKEYEFSRNLASPSDYPPLNTLPCVGTCVAFKLLELNENYSPEVSSYKEGVIKSINPKTEEIEIELTKEEIKPGRIGKFENLKEGELPVMEVTDKVKTCWSSLIEPRLVSRQ